MQIKILHSAIVSHIYMIYPYKHISIEGPLNIEWKKGILGWRIRETKQNIAIETIYQKAVVFSFFFLYDLYTRLRFAICDCYTTTSQYHINTAIPSRGKINGLEKRNRYSTHEWR